MLGSEDYENNRKPSIRRTNFVVRHHNAFQKMSEVFLDSTILFGFSVSFAGLPSVYVAPTQYQQDIARGTSLFSTNIPLCLFILVSRTIGKAGFRSILICILVILTFAVQLLTWLTAESIPNDEISSGQTCFDNQQSLLWFCSISLIIYFIVFLVYVLQSQILAPDQILSKKHKIFFLFAGVIGASLIWIDLTYILVLRQSKLKLAAATDLENYWDFGQILVLLIWLPVFVEYFHSLSRKFSLCLSQTTV